MGLLDKLSQAVSAQGNQQQQQQQQPQQTPVSGQKQYVDGTNRSSMQLANNGEPAGVSEGNEPKSPLDTFKDLFHTETKLDEQGNPIPESSDKRLLPLDKDELAKAINDLDFVAGDENNAELVQKVTDGDSSVLPELLNNVVRRATLQQSLVTSELLERMGSTVQDKINSDLPERFRDFSSQNAMSENPIFQNPAAQPVVNGIRTQIQMKNPDASPKEVNELTNNFLNQFADLVKGGANDGEGSNKSSAGKNAADWGNFFAQ